VKDIGYIRAGDSTYTVTPPQSQPYDVYTSKFEAYNANAEGLYSISMLNTYINLYRGYRWGISFRMTLWTMRINLVHLHIKGENNNGYAIEYKPQNPNTYAFTLSPNLSNSGLSLDYHLNSVFNLKLDIIPYSFSYDNTFSLGMQRYTQKGDDRQFLSYISNKSQFSVHISYYIINQSNR
jgi:hypothetical protein